ncbi:MAG: YfcE family phosphodiesterase [Bacilli bacterium]
MVISDTHHDTERTKRALSLFSRDHYDKLFLLGDLGDDCISLLNPYTEKILAVCGNCDSYKDIRDARFDMSNTVNYDYDFSRLFLLTHGHEVSPFHYEGSFDVFLYGHYHVGRLEEDSKGRIFANPGSLGLPRDNTHSLLLIDEKGLSLYDIDGERVTESLPFGRKDKNI